MDKILRTKRVIEPADIVHSFDAAESNSSVDADLEKVTLAHCYLSLLKLSCRCITMSTFTSWLLPLLGAKLATHAAKAPC